MKGEPVLQTIETGEPARFNDTAMAVFFHVTIYYLLALVSIIVKSYKEYQNDEDGINEDPIMKMINAINQTLKLIPMLLILLIFSVLRAKIVRILFPPALLMFFFIFFKN